MCTTCYLCGQDEAQQPKLGLDLKQTPTKNYEHPVFEQQ